MSTPIVAQKSSFPTEVEGVDRIFGAPVEKVVNSLCAMDPTKRLILRHLSIQL